MLLTRIKISSLDNIIGQLSSERDVQVKIIRCKADGPTGGVSILSIDSRIGTNEEDVRGWFDELDSCKVVSIASITPGRYIVSVKNERCKLCHVLNGTNCFLESGSSMINNAVLWKILTPNNNEIRGVVERLRNEGCAVELLSVKKAVSSFELTRTQEEAVRLAFSMGYYDVPKRVTLEELAARSGVSKATLNLILRRGQRKIISERLGN
jgi:predicted DNA binding protein